VTLSLVSLICFLAVTLAVGAVALVLRDLYSPRRVTAGGAPGGLTVGRGGLRRQPTVFDEEQSRSVSGRLDQAFDRLILETGYELTPHVAFLGLLASGLLFGGMLWVYYDQMLVGICGTMIGMVVPLAVMSIHRRRRLRAIREQLPMVLDLLARAVRAGSSADGAIRLVGAEADGTLGREFHHCSRQIDLGRSLASVMQALAARIRVVELRILATTLSVQRQTGGNLAETLERMGTVIRDRLSAQRQMLAATAAGRASALLIATISPIAYAIMFFWQPDHMRILFEDPMGQLMLTAAIALELIGMLWVVALLRQES
jgi:tight adherence protein B